ncbi:MAG: mannose-1-phosphate guanylyltransferase/mannose-6-phosphate isomerase [Candidatus Gastranaerophilales bacterium]|nr:mannose-1-phosphate guanylyltransferase/mannose-6-phosphate isomerase [Candidatus Gastranaerophilales bacterium]
MHVIILAGGSGSRLWPISREFYPKQLLKLTDNTSLLQATFERISSFVEPSKIILSTNVELAANVKIQLNKKVIEENVLSEPVSKDTAPAIACSMKFVEKLAKNNDEIVLVVPSDHIIKNISKFADCMKNAENLAKKGYIVTFGVPPVIADTGYGYIETIEDKDVEKINNKAFKVKQFTEKPDKKLAEDYIKSGSHFWNSGMFMFKISTFKEQMSKYMPEIESVLSEIDFDKTTDIPFMSYDKMPNISIDYALMEKSDNIVMLPLESDWKDLGSWEAIYDVKEKDTHGNAIAGKVIAKKCKNSLIFGNSKLVSAIGVNNLVVVETSDAVLVCDKNKTHEVKDVYNDLKKTNNDLYMVHKTVYRPWGYYKCIEQGEGFLTKIIHLSPRQQLSYQMHNHRSEHWVVLSGKAKILLEDKEYVLNPGQSIDIPLKAKHSLQNPFFDDLEIIEVQLGDKLIEEDIIRFKDIYGRENK